MHPMSYKNYEHDNIFYKRISFVNKLCKILRKLSNIARALNLELRT